MNYRLHAISLAATLLIASASANAQTQIGYTTGKMDRNTVFHHGNGHQQGLAIRLSHDKLQALSGQTITGIYTAFGTVKTTGKKANLFIASSLDGAHICEQQGDIASANRWATYNLNQPYTITGQEEELYIGYTLETTGDNIQPLQADHTNEQAGCSYVWNGSEWSDLYGMGKGSANIRAILGQTVDFADVMLSSVDLEGNYYLVGNEYQHSTLLYNFGTQTLSSIDVTVKVNDEQHTTTIDGLSVKQFATYELPLPALSSAQTGATDVLVEVKVNGATETDTQDNMFQSSAFFYPAQMERNILVEEFTGMTCPNCPTGKRTLDAAIEQSQLPCIEIVHHSGYAPDFYSIDADYDYTWYYGSGSTYAPAAMFNRMVNHDVAEVPVINIGLADCLSSLQQATNKQPYVSLKLSSAYNAETRQVDIDFGLLAHNSLPGECLLNVFLIQDSIIGYQSNGGSDYAHNGVMRQILTGNTWGMLLPENLAAGQQEGWTYSFTLPQAIYSDFWTPALLQQVGYTEELVTLPTDPEHMRIVAYVAHYNPNDFTDNRVFNCIEVPLVNGNHIQAGMSSSDALEAITSDPTSRNISCDLTGRVLSTNGELPAGLYIINGKKAYIR